MGHGKLGARWARRGSTWGPRPTWMRQEGGRSEGVAGSLTIGTRLLSVLSCEWLLPQEVVQAWPMTAQWVIGGHEPAE